jgi:hypothetical protein
VVYFCIYLALAGAGKVENYIAMDLASFFLFQLNNVQFKRQKTAVGMKKAGLSISIKSMLIRPDHVIIDHRLFFEVNFNVFEDSFS